MSIWFTSDTHFRHQRILSLGAGRPFDSIDEHDETLIANWNQVVQPGDHVYHLGDFGLGRRDELMTIAKRLAGQKFLLTGNHDRKVPAGLRDLFGWVKPYYELRLYGWDKNLKIVLCHYPIESWNGRFHGALHCHGHVHEHSFRDELRGVRGRYNVGVDCHKFQLVSLRQLLEAEDARLLRT